MTQAMGTMAVMAGELIAGELGRQSLQVDRRHRSRKQTRSLGSSTLTMQERNEYRQCRDQADRRAPKWPATEPSTNDA